MIEISNKKVMEKVKQVEHCAELTIHSNPTLEKIYLNMIKKDSEVYQHSLSVCRVAVLLGVYYNMNLNELIDIAVGSLLHDIGKVYLNKDILYKPDRLSDDERIFIEAHTSLGYKMIKEAEINPTILDIIKSHHEKLDGRGYPEGLHNPQISIYVQLVTVADIYDALISPRVYKEPFSQEQAFRIMEEEKGLNSIAVSILKDILSHFELNNE